MNFSYTNPHDSSVWLAHGSFRTVVSPGQTVCYTVNPKEQEKPMIPTREQIEADWANPRFTPETTALIWLRAMRDEIDRLQADLDRANTEAALARDAMAKATTDTRAKVQNELRSVERALCSADVLIKYAAWSRGAYECHVKNTIETAIDALRDDSATTPYSPPFEGDPKDCAFKATTPAPEREAAIRAWEKEALFDMYEYADDDEKAHQDDAFLVRRREITAAVAMMRSAGDGKELLRELREDLEVYPDGIWTTREMVAKIDLLRDRHAPSHVYSRGRTIAESAEPPTAYYPPAPVEQPTQPDDTRELVAQLADIVAEFFVAPWCYRATDIAAKLRKPKS